ncbi:uncharacterized protein BXZ73DRAFT_91841 [Epithele typhae]|uniref:uncharacterized protein n=1 Tax=Epithele typhae TaxID=378194 RepID=UPI002007489A|nr:uncharacterized protein BXZ73DRAFT_91841 [Epithele typhae]KAH9921218.1 hypothetical protein BXZ73DRAFT_91841 [Epithele typhae]
MAFPGNLVKFGLTKLVSRTTAKRWMRKLGRFWKHEPTGQYVDGHEREDVVNYRQKIFLPVFADALSRTRTWDVDGWSDLAEHQVVHWFHDESTFYAHDRRTLRWVREQETAVPRPKGEGMSLMVADFMSADHGWLRSPDGRESARVLFKAGKNRDGYFTHEEILAHATTAMDILEKHFPEEEHVFIFDNAPTHVKRADDALSARKMSKFHTREEHPPFGVKVIYGSDGKPLKTTIPMRDGRLPNGQPQPLYFETGHPQAGVFKGMVQILTERGYNGVKDLKAQFYGRSLRFMQHYRDGLNGAEAAWATKKYASHRGLPPRAILERADITTPV